MNNYLTPITAREGWPFLAIAVEVDMLVAKVPVAVGDKVSAAQTVLAVLPKN